METKNYKLFLTDDSSMDFLSWREKINGQTDSNMIKIDTALSEKAKSSISINLTLLASGWVGADTPYTQEISVDGLKATHNGTISIAHNATIEQRTSARDAMLAITGQQDGVLIVSADGELPEIDIPITIIIIG